MPSSGPPRPLLSVDQYLQQGDNFRHDQQELISRLKSIQSYYASDNSPPHSGETKCATCDEKSRQILNAYYSYFLSNDPGRWHSQSHQAYKDELQAMFDQSSDLSGLDAICDRSERELRAHLLRSLSAVQPGDTEDVIKLRIGTAELIDSPMPLKDALGHYLDGRVKTAPNEDAVSFIRDINAAKTEEQRAEVYVRYYCTMEGTSKQRNLNSKYARMFREGYAHDVVVQAMRKEVEDSHKNELSSLRHQIAELQMAQSAHSKAKAKKAEKDKRILDREDVPAPKTEACCFPGCPREVVVGGDESSIECAVCDWLAQKFSHRRHAFYCTVEHAEEDFVYKPSAVPIINSHITGAT